MLNSKQNRFLYNLRRSEDGFYATPIAILALMIISILEVALYFLAENDIHAVKSQESREKSLLVAEEGINNYLWNMNQDDEYYLNQTHPAQTGWVNTTDGRYHLEVTPLESPGAIVISTGETTVNGKVIRRTVKATIQKKSFVRYIYFTDYEVGVDGETIWFITGDVIHGPLHSNDIVRINGNPVFEGKVTTHRYIYRASGSNPVFQKGYEENVSLLEVPSSNAELINWAKSAYGGYYYYGRTEIELLSNGRLNITNSNPNSTGPTGNVPLPQSGVIYVDGPQLPGKAPSTKNSSAWSQYNSQKWNSGNGNVFVSGTLSGKLTIAASNNIYITGDINYANPEQDMLGLIANNFIYINHYNQSGQDVAPGSITVKAAIFSLNNSFGFEAFADGPAKNTLTIVGSIAQAYRGPVGTFRVGGTIVSGYRKDYWYDERMLYNEPPHFIPPLNAGFEITSWEEILPR